MSDSAWTTCESPIGELTVLAGPGGITNVHFDGQAPPLLPARRRPLPAAVAQLGAYFAARRRDFDLDLDLRGNPLQRAVWRALLEIPYGTTTTYGELAAAIDESLYEPGLEPYRWPRAVGAAIGANPVPVVVPCHRVIGADGSLTGYFGGLERKRALLALEGWRPGARGGDAAAASDQLALL
ncbi:MAG: methylated-DNA--[protein]-cysteine S-methyltransferase [Solirubrobacterales bacterium]